MQVLERRTGVGKQGKKTSDPIQDFIRETKKNAKELRNADIAYIVEAKFGEKSAVDKSTVGRILRRAGLSGRLPKDSAQFVPSTFRSSLQRSLDHLTHDLPHQCIALHLDPERWGRAAVKKLYPDPGDSSFYREALSHHIRSKNGVVSVPFAELIEYKTELGEAGVWAAITKWKRDRHEYRELLIDWCLTILSLVEEIYEIRINRSIQEHLERNGARLEGQQFSLKDPFLGVPLHRRDGKIAMLITLLPNTLSAFLMCNLLTRAALAQRSDITWVRELSELEN